MAIDLFRREVFHRTNDRWLASIHIAPPRLGWIFFCIAFSALVGLTLLVVFGKVTRYEQSHGSLVPSDGLLSVVHTESGRVVRVFVEEGSQVTAGQSLMEISSEIRSAAVGDSFAAISEQIVDKENSLRNEMHEATTLAEIKKKELVLRAKLLGSQLEQVDRRLDLERERAASSLALYEQWSSQASTGVISKAQILQQHDTALEHQAQLRDLETQRLRTQQEREQVVAQLEGLPLETLQKQAQLQRQISDLAESRVQNEARRTSIVKAEASGKVTSVLVHPGDTVVPQQTLANLLPDTSTLIAELWVASRSVGQIRPGQPVVIRYQAFPYQRFGQFNGRVEAISRSAIPPNEVARILGHPVEGGEPQYRVHVTLEQQSVILGSRTEPLMPGLALDAHIIYERESIASWLFAPLTRREATRPKMGGAQTNG